MRDPCCCGCTRNIDGYQNDTVVPNYDLTTGGDISPYPRPDSYAVSSGCSGDSCGGTDEKPCGAWPYADWAAFSETATGSKVSKNFCYGHKVVSAFKLWQGQPDQDYCFGGTDSCETLSVKYCTVEVDAVRNIWDLVYDEDGYFTGETTIFFQIREHFQVTIDKQTGIKTIDFCSRTVVLPDGSTWDGVSEDWSESQTELYLDHLELVRRRCKYYQMVTEWPDSWGSDMGTFGNQLEADGGGTHRYDDPSGMAYVIGTETHTATTFKITRDDYGISETSPTETAEYLGEHSSIEVKWTNPYTLDDLIADTETLLSEWALNNNSVTLWRIDGYCALAQLVRRNESTGSPNDVGIVSPDYCSWTDPAAATYDGSIIGAPVGHAGLDFGFGWDHKSYAWCDSNWVVTYYGARTNSLTYEPTDTCMAGNVTSWTEQPDVAVNLNGAWIKVDEGGCMIQKMVEAKVGLSCVNFSWPSGKARYLMDQTKAFCINFWTDNVATVSSGDPSAVLAVDDLIVCYGGDNAGKVGTVSSVDSTTITVDFDASIPSSYVTDAQNIYWSTIDFTFGGAGGLIGKVRFTDDYNGAIVTPISVSAAVQSGSDIVLTLTSAKYLIAGDHIDVTGVSGLGTDETVSNVSGNDVTIASKTLSSPYTSGGTVRSHDAPDAIWDSTASRGDFVVQTYAQGTGASCGTIDSTPTESDETLNKLNAPLAITPNGETWSTAYYSTDLDNPSCTASGGMTAKLIVQAVTDPYFQQPASCLGVTINCPPQVEARTGVPSGAPAFPSGISYPQGVIYAAGHSAGTIYAHKVPWAVCEE